MSTRREALVFVHRMDEALVLFRIPDDSYWHVVAGGLEDGETFGAAAVRELREETGLSGEGQVHPLRRRYTWRGEDGSEVEGECYAIEAPPGWEPRLDWEHEEHRWCSPAEGEALLFWPEPRDVLRDLAHLLAVGRK